ncbi:MAG: LysM peptidoglycan-binding domain-containing protein [Armatimonadetes bacterium]|nr:LysM peptidoglycan-binding domain-containing protein [Armatimonadota bacterium]
MADNGLTERRTTRLHGTVTFLRRALLVSFALNLILAALLVRGCVTRSAARAILVDGELMCLVRSEKAADEVHDKVLAIKRGEFRGEASFRQRWEDKPWPAKGERVHTVSEAVELLKRRLDVAVEGWAIQVKGRNLVVLPSKQKAEETLSTLKAKFLSEGETALEPQRFGTEPAVARTQVPPEDLLDDIRTAANELLRGAEQPQEYVVKTGDTPYKVAEAHAMSVEQLYKLNRGLREKASRNEIQPGDTWIVAGPRPAIVVITRKEKTEVGPVPFKVIQRPSETLPKGERRVMRDGQEGEAKQRIQGTWRNDKLVPASRRVVGQEIIREPIDKVVSVGTAVPPANP